MVTIHFVGEGESQPLCRRPDRREWMWAADPSVVTCPECVTQLAPATEPRPPPDSRPQPRH